MQISKTQTIFFLSLLGLVFLLNVFIFLPYLSPLFLAVTLGVIFKPLYEQILAKVKRPGISAAISVLLVFAVILLPLAAISVQIFNEAAGLYHTLSTAEGESAFNAVVSKLTQPITQFDPNAVSNIKEHIRQGAGLVLTNFAAIFSGLVSVVFKFFLVLFALFFFWKDGAQIKKALLALSPMDNEVDNKILGRMELAINSVIKGQLTIAIVQGIVTMIGFTIFGVPNAVLWGSLTVFAALIPSVGTALVIAPAVIYLYFFANPLQAVGLLIWGIFAVGLIDNFLGPVLMTRNIKVHPFVILLSVLGGVSLFGTIGFLLGPIIVTLLLALLDIRYSLYGK
jgi:predicted PurR-regulated permease PerM